MIANLLRGIGLWVLMVGGMGAIMWLAYQFGFIDPEHKERIPYVFIGFAMAGIVTLLVAFSLIDRAFAK